VATTSVRAGGRNPGPAASPKQAQPTSACRAYDGPSPTIAGSAAKQADAVPKNASGLRRIPYASAAKDATIASLSRPLLLMSRKRAGGLNRESKKRCTSKMFATELWKKKNFCAA